MICTNFNLPLPKTQQMKVPDEGVENINNFVMNIIDIVCGIVLEKKRNSTIWYELILFCFVT